MFVSIACRFAAQNDRRGRLRAPASIKAARKIEKAKIKNLARILASVDDTSKISSHSGQFGFAAALIGHFNAKASFCGRNIGLGGSPGPKFFCASPPRRASFLRRSCGVPAIVFRSGKMRREAVEALRRRGGKKKPRAEDALRREKGRRARKESGAGKKKGGAGEDGLGKRRRRGAARRPGRSAAGKFLTLCQKKSRARGWRIKILDILIAFQSTGI